LVEKVALQVLDATAGRISIFAGPLGSGKTTVAVNVACYLAQQRNTARKPAADAVLLVDLDLINPFLRSRVLREELQKRGVTVICPPKELAQGDLPALPAAVKGALAANRPVVFDVGGDGIGATVLGAYRPYLPAGEYRFFFVVNIRRPFMATAAEIGAAVQEVAAAARLDVDYLVNNTHLGPDTSAAVVLEGLSVVREASAQLGIPVAFTAVAARLAAAVGGVAGRVLPLEIFLRLPWT
jgi:DNA polymerase III delta prime subunit